MQRHALGKSIDYWAIGVVIFELFTFKIPFEGETQEITRQNIMDLIKRKFQRII